MQMQPQPPPPPPPPSPPPPPPPLPSLPRRKQGKRSRERGPYLNHLTPLPRGPPETRVSLLSIPQYLAQLAVPHLGCKGKSVARDGSREKGPGGT
jgi:hypothetical protein